MGRRVFLELSVPDTLSDEQALELVGLFLSEAFAVYADLGEECPITVDDTYLDDQEQEDPQWPMPN